MTVEQEQRSKRDYYQGLREGVERYAHWKDGVQYVGTTGKTLKQAIRDIDNDEAEYLKYLSA